MFQERGVGDQYMWSFGTYSAVLVEQHPEFVLTPICFVSLSSECNIHEKCQIDPRGKWSGPVVCRIFTVWTATVEMFLMFALLLCFTPVVEEASWVDREAQLLLRLLMQVPTYEGEILWCELLSVENWTKTRDAAAFESIKLFHSQSP